MGNAFIGLGGIAMGILITEYFRRRNRIENYSQVIFTKRLDIYEKLYNKLNEISNSSRDIIENSSYSKDERLSRWSFFVLDLAGFLDRNKLYINEDISTHCMLTVIGVEDIHDIENAEDKESARLRFFQHFNEATDMIKTETGLKEIDNLFRRITKAKHGSDFITEMNLMKKRYQKKEAITPEVED